MKKLILSVIAAFWLGVLCLCGCGGSSDELGFYDFPQYKNFSGNVSYIEVSWDNNGAAAFEFTITDPEYVGGLVEMLRETSFQKVGGEPNDGGHSVITLVDMSGNKVDVPLFEIKYGEAEQYYKFPDDNVYNYIKQFAEMSERS